jgi:N utilization substance protein B
MINRTMVRTRVIQTLFAYYKDGDKTPLTAKKELLKSFSDTYDLYVLLLDFVNQLTMYAEEQIQQAEQRAKVTHQSYVANRRLVNNGLAQVVFNNHQIRNYIQNNQLSWDAGMSAVSAVYKQLQEMPWYAEYMAAPDCDYEADKRLWRRIYEMMIGNDQLESALEEMEVVLDRQNWTVDMDLVLSFVIKTIKRLDQETGADQDILPMFTNEDELQFAKDLLRYAIEEKPRYERSRSDKPKATFKQQKEYEQLSTDIDSLSQERQELEQLLSGGTTNPEQITQASQRIGEIIAQLDEKELRWLELDEIINPTK